MQKGDVKKASALMMIAVFAGFLTVFTLGYFVFLPTVVYIPLIEQEQKHQPPTLSLQGVIDGSFEEELETYMCESITQRSDLIALSNSVNRLLGKTYQNGIFFADDGYFIRESHFTEEAAERFSEGLGRFADECPVPIDLLIVPEAGIMLRDKLGNEAERSSFDEADRNVEYLTESVSDKVNVYYAKEPVQQVIDRGIQAYYRTDHHWTTECAKAVFEWYAEKTGLSLTDTEYEYHSVPDFYGHIYGLVPSFFAEGDELHYYTNPNGKYKITNGDGLYLDSPISCNMAKENDKYKVFLGGDCKHNEIISNAPDGNIVVIHDSFGRAFLPFLADNCSDIYSLDLRMYDKNEKRPSDLCRERGAERVLILMYTDSFSDERFSSF